MSGLSLVVDPGDPTPPYEQVRRQLVDLVSSGALVAGDRLPSLRQLAGDLGLAVGTVARAYRELEGQGLLVSRRGGGTRVAGTVAVPRQSPADRLDELTSTFVTRARDLGADDSAILEAVRRAAAAPLT